MSTKANQTDAADVEKLASDLERADCPGYDRIAATLRSQAQEIERLKLLCDGHVGNHLDDIREMRGVMETCVKALMPYIALDITKPTAAVNEGELLRLIQSVIDSAKDIADGVMTDDPQSFLTAFRNEAAKGEQNGG